MDDVEGKVIGPIPSEDGKAAQTTVTYNLGSDGWNLMPDIAKDIHKIAAIDGANVYIAGAGGQAVDSAESFEGLDSTLLLAALLVVILLLLFTYRSPVLWILPIFSVIVSLASSLGLIYFLAKYADLTVNGQSQAIVSILVIGAGTDYALLLVARYREELRRHEDRHEAMAFALHRATPAIIASASTVIVGMLCLTLAEMNSTAGLGPVLRHRRRRDAARDDHPAAGAARHLRSLDVLAQGARPSAPTSRPATGIWARVGAYIKPRPRRVWITTSILLGVCVLGVLTLNTNGLSTEDSYTKEFDSVKGQKVLTAHGLADTSTPVMVVANADKAADVAEAMTGIDNLEPAAEPVVKDGVAFITANLTVDSTTTAAFDTVDEVRTAVHAVDGADALVGGQSAIYDDMLKANTRDSKVIIPVTLLVVLLILMLLLRALTAPLILIATVVLSFGTAIGLGALAFKYLFDYPGVDPSYPAVRVRLPGLSRHRLQHLPDDESARGDGDPWHPRRVPRGPGCHGWRDHLGRARAGGDVRHPRVAAAGVPGRARLHRRAGRPDRHDHHPLGAGHGDQPRHGQPDLVAEQARSQRPSDQHGGRRADPPRRRTRRRVRSGA